MERRRARTDLRTPHVCPPLIMPNPARDLTARSEFPWWLVVAIALAAVAAVAIFASDLYSQVFSTVAKGIGITVVVTVVSFALRCRDRPRHRADGAVRLGMAAPDRPASMSRSSAACRSWCCCSGSHLPACRPSSPAGIFSPPGCRRPACVGALHVRDVLVALARGARADDRLFAPSSPRFSAPASSRSTRARSRRPRRSA